MAVSDLLGGTSVGTFLTGFIPQMILGDYLFSLNTAAYQSLDRQTEYRWGSQERFGAHEALQFLGPGGDTINLAGIVYPSYRGGAGQVQELRDLAARGEPLQLIGGTGNVYGRWVVEGITEKQGEFAPMGTPRKQEFTVKMRHFDGGGYNALVQFVSSLF